MSVNPFMGLSPAAIDVLDDMVSEWSDRDRHAELYYGPKKAEALSRIREQISEAWKKRVHWNDVESSEND